MRIIDEIILLPKDKFCRKNKFATKIFLFKGRRLILVAKSFCNKKNVLLPIDYSDFFYFLSPIMFFDKNILLLNI